MRKFRVGELYYYKDTKSVVKILRKENLNSRFVFAEVIFSDGNLNKGNKGECETNLLKNKAIALWI